MAVIVFVAIFAPLLAPYDPFEQFRGFTKLPPFWAEGSDPRYILGTDAVGRDMLSRLIYGSRVSLFIGLSVMVVSMVVGVALGLAAAWFGGIIDVVILRIMDLIMSIPSLVLAILIIAVIGPNLTNTIVAVTIVGLPRYVRLVRASAITELSKDYVIGAKVAGNGPLRLMMVTVLPNCMAPLIVQSALGVSDAISRGSGPWLSRPRRAAADAGMGRDARRFARSHALASLGHGVARHRHPDHGARHQPHGRWPARRARSAPQAELMG